MTGYFCSWYRSLTVIHLYHQKVVWHLMNGSDLVFSGTIEEINHDRQITCRIKLVYKGQWNDSHIQLTVLPKSSGSFKLDRLDELRIRDSRIFFARCQAMDGVCSSVQLLTHLHVNKILLDQLRVLSASSKSDMLITKRLTPRLVVTFSSSF